MAYAPKLAGRELSPSEEFDRPAAQRLVRMFAQEPPPDSRYRVGVSPVIAVAARGVRRRLAFGTRGQHPCTSVTSAAPDR